MCVLHQSIGALVDGGVVLDLQSVPPEPAIECDGVVLGSLVSPDFWALADANNAHVDSLVAAGTLVEEGRHAHEVLVRWPTGRELAEEWQPARRRLPPELYEAVGSVDRECVIHEPCLTRRFRYRADV